MYLSKLELQGFKSFALRTRIDFAPGVTAIVGPNGCGKSNIVDAVRWVVGEQRARMLRSDKMDNVIFNGTNKRKPLGMSEVLLTIENNRGVLPTEYREVTIGRRLYRSGESEYLLNGVRCRLQDILDLFLDTGMGSGAYSVIELKMIDEILSENYQDRRRLFEEAAGITRYKLRRKQAMGKLEGTQADLTRLRDLIDEIDKRVRGLKRQAEKAARLKAYQERLQILERTLARTEYDRLAARQKELLVGIAIVQEAIAVAETEISVLEADLEADKAQLLGLETEAAEHRKRLAGHLEAVRALESDLRVRQERIRTTNEEIARLEAERKEQTARRESLLRAQAARVAALAEQEPQLEVMKTELGEAGRRRDETRKVAEGLRNALAEIRKDETRAAEETAAARSRLDRLVSRYEMLEQELKRLNAELGADGDRSGALHASVEEAKKQLDALTTSLEEARTLREQYAARRTELRTKVEEATGVLREAEKRREAAAAEVRLLESMVSDYEDVSAAVQHLAESGGWTQGKLTTVADVLVCADEDRLVLDAALGALAGCIVVADEREAGRAVAELKQAGKGRATFLLLNRITASSVTAEHPQGAIPLRERVQVIDTRYEALPGLLLHDCYRCNTAEEATTAATAGGTTGRYFTPSGEWFGAEGMQHGGSAVTAPSPMANRIGRREQLAHAAESLNGLQEEVAAANAALQHLRTELNAIPFDRQSAEVDRLQRLRTEADKNHARAVHQAETYATAKQERERRIETLEVERTEASDAVAEHTSGREQAEAKLTEIRKRRAAAEEAFNTAEADARSAVTLFNERNIAVIQAGNRLDNLRREIASGKGTLNDLEHRLSGAVVRLNTLAETRSQAEVEMAELQRSIEDFYDGRLELDVAAGEAEKAVAEKRSKIVEVESRLRSLRIEREGKQRQEGNLAVQGAEVTTRMTHLVEHIKETFGIDLAEIETEAAEGLDEPGAHSEVTELRDKIRALGNVNALALEEYEEESQRLAFLQEQLNDLRQAETTLLDTIKEINTTASARFLETYEAIRTGFRQIFMDLFGEEAAADLEIVHPTDPLESPIEIHARPRGKRPSTISQLSGGEKTLTAIALLFAIYLVKPSPFCILDEVDAPLDDANIERFMDLIRSFSRETQFIVVTHNKRSMEAADRMYGITMQEQGVSSIVGVQFADLEETLESP